MKNKYSFFFPYFPRFFQYYLISIFLEIFLIFTNKINFFLMNSPVKFIILQKISIIQHINSI